jgi:hypothetical protein
VLPIALAAVVVGAFFLGLYLRKGYSMPIGWDTARYLSEANMAADRGLSGIRSLPSPPHLVLAGRVGYSVIDLSLSSLFTISTFKVAAAIPVAAAIAMALAGGALASAGLRLRSWDAAVVAVVVGVSPTAIRLMAPETYAENLLALAPLTAAVVVVAATAPPDRRAMAAIVVLLVGGALSHAPAFTIVVAALGLAAAWYAPWSWRAWRRGSSGILATPAGFLGTAVGGAALLFGVTLFGLLGTGLDTFRQTRSRLVAKLRQDVPIYRFPLTLPIAGIGLAALIGGTRARRAATPRDPGRDPEPWTPAALAMITLVGWVALTAGGVGLFLLGWNTPAHRLLALLVPLPLLGGLGFVAAGRAVAAKGGRLLGAAVLLALLSGALILGHRLLYVEMPTEREVLWMDPQKIQDAATAADYLDAVGVAEDAPVVFLVDDRGPQPSDYTPLMANMIRSVLPTDRIERSYLYVGDVEHFLAGRPTLRGRPRSYDGNSLRFYTALEPVLDDRPVALLVSSYNAAFGDYVDDHPDRVVGPGVAVVQGPLPTRPVGSAVSPSGPQGFVQVALVGGATFGVLALAGLGWAVALAPRGLRSFEVIALTPAMGIAVVVIGGLLADRLGIGLTGAGGAVLPLVIAAAGVGAAVPRLRRYGWALFEPR